MNVTGDSIEAVLTLNASGFKSPLENSIKLVKEFQGVVKTTSTNASNFSASIRGLIFALEDVNARLTSFVDLSKETESFNKFANGVKALASAVKTLGENSENVSAGMTRVVEIIESMQGVLQPTKVQVTGLANALRELNQSTTSSVKSADASLKEMQQDLLNLGNSAQSLRRIQDQTRLMNAEFQRSRKELMQFAQYGVQAFNQIDARSDALKSQIASMNAEFERSKAELLEFARYGRSQFETIATSVEKVAVATKQYDTALTVALPKQRDMIINATGVASAMEKEAVSKDKATASTNRLTSSTSRLSKVMSSLRMIGTMVASMFVWNFASSLVTATRETVNAKSEMEGYFQMLHFSQSEIDQFNRALDQTVGKFQRINKYSLGETISSIGVEFNLTTQEMEKAMPVVSMITSEYLRAGRNANEASLAVKDILQGEFQRLSRETGVKGDQLKEAGWSGDKNDVMGLLEALDTVGKSRNWDIFVTKANSLNDAVLILQNRFGEWSADMVNVVQPTILAVFNNLMAFGQGASQSLSGMWEWLNSDSWGATATKIGLLTTAILTMMPVLTAWRSGSKLIELANLSLSQQLTSLIFGIKAETVAIQGSSSAIGMHILGIKQEEIAEINASLVQQGRILGLEAEEIAQVGLMDVIRAKILGVEAEKIVTMEASEMNFGFVGSLYAMITGEALAEAETLSLSGALAILTGTFLASPIGWFTLLVLGLASAFYVLTGGLSDAWEKMHQFNETMRDTGSAQKEAYKWLDQVKEKAGEDSQAFKDASDSVETYVQNLQSASYWYNESQTAFNGLDLTSETTGKGVLEKYGISKDEIDEWNANIDTLTFGKKKYVRAEEVLNKQLEGEHSNFAKDLDEYLGKVEKNGGDLEEAYDKMKGNYDALAYHSYVANTTDSWWEWLWNSLYAGMDQFWIDWDMFWADPDWEGAINGLWQGLKNITLGDWISQAMGVDGAEDFDVGAYITESLGGVVDYFNSHTLMEILGLDESHDYGKDIWDWIDNTIIKPIVEFDWLGELTNGLKRILPQIDLLGVIFDLLLPQGDYASDGSSDHPSFMEDVSAILGFDVQSWIDSFNADPFGTLGIELPQIDIIGMIKSLIPMDGGSFDLGQWLKDIFNVDGIIDYFTSNLPSIVTTVTDTASVVMGKFSELKDGIRNHLTNVVTNVSTGFENAKTYATTKITQMKDSVKGVIDQMTDAWKKMKDSILESAKLIYDGVKSKFDEVKTTLKDFFTKLQNPAQWGAGQKSMSRSPRPATARKLFGGFTGTKHGAGINPYSSPNQKVRLSDLIDIVGDKKQVTLSDFLSMFTEGGFGGWDFHEPSKKRIFDVGKEWKSAPAVIKGIGSVGNGYKVGRFWDGKPTFTWDEFMATAEAIFSAIPYKFYYDSDWKGNWVNALLSGATNCSDGSDALIALASVFGFSGEKIHTTTKNGTGHFYARINGHNLDTTHFQNGRSWTPLGAGVSPRRSAGAGKTVHITNDFRGATIYGVDDLDERIKESTKEAMREEFNDPYTIAL